MENLREEFEEYLTHERGYRPRTIQDYMYYFDKFEEHEGFINQKTLYNFLVQRYPNSLSRAFVKLYLKFLNTKHQYSYNSEKIMPEPKRKKGIKIPHVITEKEVLKLTEAMRSERDRLGVLLSFYGGLRLQEMLQVKATDFDWETWVQDPSQTGKLHIKKDAAKGGMERNILLPAHIMDRIYNYIKKYCEPTMQNELFRSFQSGNIISKRRWQNIIEVRSIEALNKKIHPHTLRHSFGTYCIENGMNIEEVRKLLGHRSISTTQIYLHISDAKLKESYTKVFEKPQVA